MVYLYDNFIEYLVRIKEIFIQNQREFWFGVREWLKEQGCNLYIYLNLIIILVLLSIVCYIKWQFPFWNTMPVFHYYDIWRYFVSKPSIVRSSVVRNTGGYCHFEKVKTYSYNAMDDSSLKETMMDLMKNYYLTTDNTFNTSTIEDMNAIMTGQIHPSYISFYNECIYNKESPFLLPVGCITSHCYCLILKDYRNPIYYLDYLSISNHSVTREKINQKRVLTQTHLINQQLKNPSVPISLFKKEGPPIRGLVPFVQYKTFFFSLGSTIRNKKKLGDHFVVVRIDRENKECLNELLETVASRFEISIVADLPNIVGLINQKLVYVYVLKRKGKICGYYFIRSDRIEWDGEAGDGVAGDGEGTKTSIELVASWNKTFPEVFYRGFLFSLKDMVREDKRRRILKINDISDNSVILLRWAMEMGRSFTQNENAYYFYNFIYPYYEGYSTNKKCFILI
jgi:hypothetical protein